MSELDKWTLERIRYLLEPSSKIIDEMEHDDPAELVCDPVEMECKNSSEMECKQVLRDILNQYELPDLLDLRDHLEGLKEIRDDVRDEFCNEMDD